MMFCIERGGGVNIVLVTFQPNHCNVKLFIMIIEIIFV